MHFLNTVVARAIPFIPRALVRKISRRYIAGDTLTDAVTCGHRLAALGFSATLDVLGESVTTMEEAARTAGAYIRSLDAIHADGLHADISIKPSALGLLLHPQGCEQLVRLVLDAAQRHGTFVCIDMEDVSCTQLELELFLRLRASHDNVGLAVQAYLLRSYSDMDVLMRAQSVLRICKGIYREAQLHLVPGAWNDRQAINPHFLQHVARCFDSGMFVAIATHDAVLIEQIVALAAERKIAPTRFEFQMLLGVCEPLRDKLRNAGFNVRIYVPYGEDWYAYSTRRLKENPRIAGHVLRALLGF